MVFGPCAPNARGVLALDVLETVVLPDCEEIRHGKRMSLDIGYLSAASEAASRRLISLFTWPPRVPAALIEATQLDATGRPTNTRW